MSCIVNIPWKLTGRSMALVCVLVQLACAPVLLAGPPRAQKHDNRHEVERIEEAWRNAVLKANVATMETLLGDDYVGITATGTIETKEKALANMRAGVLRFTSIKLSERKLRFYGTTALVTSRAEVAGTNASRDFSGNYRYTHVYARDALGKWKIVSFEASRIRDLDEHK